MRSIVGRNQETTRSNVFCVVSEALAPTIRRDLRDVRKDRVEVELSANSTSSGHWFEPNSAPTSGKPAPAALLIQTNAVPRQNGHFVVTPRATNPHDSGSSPGGPISTPRSHAVWLNHAVRLVPYVPVLRSGAVPGAVLEIRQGGPEATATGDPQLATPGRRVVRVGREGSGGREQAVPAFVSRLRWSAFVAVI